MALPFVATGAASADEKKMLEIPVTSLSTFQKKDQRAEYLAKALSVLREKLSSSDAADAVRLSLRCASNFDYATKTGGFNGSIMVNPAELNRPENANLKPFAEKLRKVKADVDAAVAELGYGPISYADLMVLASKVSCQKKWAEEKAAGGSGDAAKFFPNVWEVTLGRIDSPEVGPFRLPADDAPVPEIAAALAKMGAKPNAGNGPFDPRPPFQKKYGYILWAGAAKDPKAEEARLAAGDANFADAKKEYDISRATVTRTSYEVDFAEQYNKLAALGAKYDPNAYLKSMKMLNFVS